MEFDKELEEIRSTLILKLKEKSFNEQEYNERLFELETFLLLQENIWIEGFKAAVDEGYSIELLMKLVRIILSDDFHT